MPGQDGVASDEAELVEPRKADIEAEHEGQHELVGAHGSGDPFGREGFFQQRLEAEFFEQGGDGQQAAVGSQILATEVIGRGSPDFIGPRGPRAGALFDGPSGAMLFSLVTIWVTSLGLTGEAEIFASLPFYPLFSGIPKWFLAAQPSPGAPAVHNSGYSLLNLVFELFDSLLIAICTTHVHKVYEVWELGSVFLARQGLLAEIDLVLYDNTGYYCQASERR